MKNKIKKNSIVFDLNQDCFVKVIKINTRTNPNIYTVLDENDFEYCITEDDVK